ncbi:MAG: rhomboid family intramembrane serine protease [Ignavibacteriota bacterium]
MANFGRPGMGRSSLGGFLEDTPVIRTLLLANVAMFAFGIFFGKLRLAGVPIDFYITKYLYLWPLDSGNFYPWQLFTYMFLHGGFMHILFNMWMLWICGTAFERIWGPKKLILYYFLCGLGGAVAHLVISPLLGGSGPLIGASGAIYGLLIAYGLLFPENVLYIFGLIPLKAKYLIGISVAYELYSIRSNDSIGHLAHLGGAVAGLIYLLATSGGLKLFSNFSLRRSQKTSSDWASRSSGPGMFRRRHTDDEDAIDAEYRDIGGTATKTRISGTRIITQEDVDRILDKIAALGYQNLSEEEREILIEASRKMDQRG